jgi:uncharacterized RDD family membrane protein YckC
VSSAHAPAQGDEATARFSWRFAFAAPHLRALAAAIDVLVLLGAQVLLVLALPLEAASSVGLTGAWLYLWAGWARGRTPGKRLFRLRVVREDGGAMDARSSLARVAAYALALWPAKLGLAPILWDAQRRGWHDRLARTRVLDLSRPLSCTPPSKSASRCLASKYLQESNGPSLAPDQFAAELRRALRALAVWAPVFFAVGVWWTWPLSARWDTHLAGGRSEAFFGDHQQFAWGYWHWWQAWREGRSPFESGALFFPHTVSLRLQTLHPHNSTLAWIYLSACQALRGAVSVRDVVTVSNFLLLATPVATACSTFVLCATLCGRGHLERGPLWKDSLSPQKAACACAAVSFAFGAFAAARSMGHFNLLSAQWLPVWALCLLGLENARSQRHPRAAILWAGASGLALALCAWCDWHWLLFALALAVPLAFAWPPGIVPVVDGRPRASDVLWARPVWWALALACGLALLGPLLGPLLGTTKGSSVMDILPAWSADAADWISPSPLHALWGAWAWHPWRDEIEWIVSPGCILLVGAALGLKLRPRCASPWLVAAGVSVLLASGPQLRVAGQVRFSPLVLLAAGPPAHGWDSYDRNRLSSLAGELLPIGAPVPSLRGERVVLPFKSLRQWLRPLRTFRVPARFSIVAALCLSVSASLGWSALLEGLAQSQKLRRAPQRAIVAVACAPLALVAATVCEVWRAPLPGFDMAHDAARSPFPYGPASGKNRGAIAEAPWIFSSPPGVRGMWEQMRHGRPLVNAYLSRPPRLPSNENLLRRNALLRALEGEAAGVSWETNLHWKRAEVWEQRGPWRDAARRLRLAGVHSVLLRREALAPDDFLRADRFLRVQAGAQLVKKAPAAWLYDLP